MEGVHRRSLGSQAQHTHSLEDHTWSVQQSTTTHTKHFHNIQQQNSNYTKTHWELFHQIIYKHATHKTNIANYIKGCKACTTYRNHAPNNVNLKMAFHKVESFHPHYLTFTPQTYHHTVHRFRSWPTQTTSHPHTQVRVQPRNTYNHTYKKILSGQNKTTSY